MSRPQIEDLESIFINDIPLIDVRAPVEYAKGSLPTAINLPLLTDRERDAVGTCYRTQGKDAAISLGNKLVCGKVKAERLNYWQRFTEKHPNGALFCFRGGLRSEVTQQWLSEEGIEFPSVRGGYKAMRRWLVDAVSSVCADSRFIILGGKTGVAKTRLINCGAQGRQLPRSIDLEGLANHRGSAFGHRITEQPSQIAFELALGVDLVKLRADDAGSILLEDEGRLIGRCAVPEPLQKARSQANWVELIANLEDRIQHSYENYILSNLRELEELHGNKETAYRKFSEGLLSASERIRKRLGGTRYKILKKLINKALTNHQAGDPEQHKLWIEMLLTEYYDPMYDYQMSRRGNLPMFSGYADAVLAFLRDYHTY